MRRRLVSAVLATYNDENNPPHPGTTLWHWCPECKDLHPLPWGRWTFNENYEKPTFTPSFRQFPQSPRECHYNITDGMIVWHDDNKHSRRSGSEPMVPLTPEMLDMP